MVGPDVEGMGGISRVVKIWQNGHIFFENGIRYISTTTHGKFKRIYYLIKGFALFILSILRKKTIVYVHTSSYNSFRRKSLFIAAALFLKKKIILHIHPSHFFQFLLNIKGLEKILTYFLLEHLHALVVLTEQMRIDIQKLLPQKPIYVLRNPVDIKVMQNTGNHIRANNKLLYLGWYIKEKGIYDLVDAIEILRTKGVDIYLEFYGPTPRKELQSYVKQKQLDKVISVNGWIYETEKCIALYQSTALVLPTYSEGIPNVILEAMATKTPIISTLVGGLKEVLIDKENAIIAHPGDPRDLSDKIFMCLKDEELRNRIALNAYHDVLTKYDLPVIKKELSSILAQFL